MKKTGIMLLLCGGLLILAACGNNSAKKASLKDDVYILKGNRMGPYLYFNTQKSTWRIGPGMMYSAGIGGEYEIRGNLILARETVSKQIVLEVRIISDEILRIEKFSEEFFPPESRWVAVGDEFFCHSLTDNTTDIDSIFRTVTKADGALAVCKDTDVVVIEGSRCTSGKEVWDSFYAQVSSGNSARVLVARYYVLDREHVSEELYQQKKDQYPKLFYYLVEYDGSRFIVTVRQSSEENDDFHGSFAFLKHYVGDLPSTAVARHYDRYVLVDDPDVSWEDIMKGWYSSDSTTPRYRHLSVYDDLYD